jgi:hypothetical protein
MAQLNRTDYKNKVDTTITTNGAEAITGALDNDLRKDQADSFLNLLSDEELLNLRDYDVARTYKTGEACLYDSGGGSMLYRANKQTTGAFIVADWDLVAGGGGASPLTTKGDLFTHDGAADERLGVGTDGQVLMADSVEATGLKYKTLAAADISDFDTEVSNNTDVTANTAKVSNVTTDLGQGTHDTTTLEITSSDGTNTTLPSATQLLAGLMSAADKTNLDSLVGVLSPSIVYVSTNGSDVLGEGEAGNINKPFATFNAAFAAAPATNFIIKSLGGSFTEDIVLAGTFFYLDLSGTKITGSIGRGTNEIKNATINLQGGEINMTTGTGYAVDIGATLSFEKVSIVGGKITSVDDGVLLRPSCTIENCTIIANSGVGFASLQNASSERCKVINCTIEALNGFSAGKTDIINTIVRATGYIGQCSSHTMVKDCKMETTSASEYGLRPNPSALNHISLYLYDSYIKAVDYALVASLAGGSGVKLRVENSILESTAEDSVFPSGLSTSTAATESFVFKNTTFYAASGKLPFTNVTAGNFLGNIEVVNPVYNRTHTTPQAYINEYNKVEIVDLEAPTIEI